MFKDGDLVQIINNPPPMIGAYIKNGDIFLIFKDKRNKLNLFRMFNPKLLKFSNWKLSPSWFKKIC